MSQMDSADEALNELAGLAADRGGDAVTRILATARLRLGMDLCVLGHFARGREFFRAVVGEGHGPGIVPGGSWPAQETLGARVLDGRIQNVINDAAIDVQVSEVEAVRAWRVGAYIAVPVVLAGDRTYGVLECLSHQPAPWLGERATKFLQVLARLVADEVEREVILGEKERIEVDRIRSVLAQGSVSMVFQPIIDLHHKTIVGVEALARFGPQPERSPDSWFAEAAVVGLRTDLELLAVAAALAQLEALPSRAYLSINASPETVMSPRFLSLLDGPLGDRLVVEITEHAVIDDYTALGRALEELRRRGCRLALDDTGGGLATRAHIHRLLPDIIKLDASLTHEIDRDPVRRSLVGSLIAFAEKVGATVSAEGIETQGEEETLRALGVPFGQGWFLAEPGAMADVTRTVPSTPELRWLMEGISGPFPI
jgi:EAL domain-containing protein (putative c-di-GMP-specific phosphodiesterase class I)